jgi:hypothetical protein
VDRAAFVWLRLYQAQMRGLAPPARDRSHACTDDQACIAAVGRSRIGRQENGATRLDMYWAEHHGQLPTAYGAQNRR